MAQHIVTIFCEGPHDVAFLVKILKTSGYKSQNGLKIKDFPTPYNNMAINDAKKSYVDGLNIQELRRNSLPSEVISKEDYYFFFYSMGGESKKKYRKELLTRLCDFIPKEEGENSLLPKNATITSLYFFDADKKGVQNRLKEVSKEINEISKDIDDVSSEIKNLTFTENGEVIPLFNNKLKLGVYIFSDEDGKGDLEDILMPLMKEDNETIFDEAEKYLNSNFDEKRLFSNKLYNNGGVITEKRETSSRKKEKYYKNKSILGVVGQLQKSGSSNVVCIGQTDYITLNKVKASKNCDKIISFFNKVFE